MKKILRLSLRVIAAFSFLFVMLIIFMLNPQLMYGREREHRNSTIYSRKECPAAFNKIIDKADTLIRQSELYDSSFHFRIFVNDGSSFPAVLKKVLGDAFAWGYYRNIVLNGTNDESYQYILLNGYKRHLARTVAHEMIHCLQANKFGILGSRPLKNIPYWKWEGYPEYIAYLSPSQNEDSVLISNLAILDKLKNEKWYPVEIQTIDGLSFAGLDYFRWWLMVKYCIDIKKMRFAEIIKPEIKYDNVYSEMMNWYQANKYYSFSPPAGP